MGTRVCYRCAVEQRRDTKRIGDFAELAVMTALVEAGYRICIPFGENHRYDLIADGHGKLLRVQVKNGNVRNGAVRVPCSSSHAHRGGSCRRYVGEIDAFGVYCPQRSEVYLVPISDVQLLFGIQLRVEPTRNGQAKRLRWAEHYLLGKVTLGRDCVSERSTDSDSLPS